MIRVGLTGGIGSGKSTVSGLLAELGAVVIDYDLLAREAVEPGTPALAAIVERFGAGVLAADGTLDRPALGEIVFGDEEARRDLNSLTHGAVGALAWEREQAAPEGSVVVHDIPLLVETGLYQYYETVVVVDVPVEVQRDRLVRLRGMTPADADARIAAQATREQRLEVATHVIDNSGDLAALRPQVAEFWSEITR